MKWLVGFTRWLSKEKLWTKQEIGNAIKDAKKEEYLTAYKTGYKNGVADSILALEEMQDDGCPLNDN